MCSMTPIHIKPIHFYIKANKLISFYFMRVIAHWRKQVDIEVNGEPVNIHMKLGESGEAFFVQEIPETDADELPENLATSPLPSEEYANKYNDR